MRRTPALTKRVRQIAEEILTTEMHWPWSSDPRFEETGLTPSQVRDALWGAGADEWRRDLLRRYKEEKHRASS